MPNRNFPTLKPNNWIRPSTIACGYGVIAGIWILGSGLLLDAIVGRDGDVRSLLEQAKGFAFVGVTSFILWLVLRRFAASLERLAAHSSRLAQFPQLSPNPVVELGAAGQILSVNMAATLAARSEPGGIEDLLPVEYAAIGRDTMTSGEARTQVPVSRNNRSWEWTIFPVVHPPGAYAFGVERTEEQKLQAQVQQAARMESVGRMAAGVAHDLNNILTAIGGYASLAKMDSDPEGSTTEELEGIQSEVERASLLVKKLLSISRMRAPETVRRRVDVIEHVAGFRSTLRHLVPARVRLTMSAPPGQAFVDVDPAELEQALLNLVANAVDAIDNQGEIEVCTRVADAEASITVRDTGTGIPSELLNRVFDPFFTTKDEGRGTGLGLASVNAFAQRSGGRVDVETAPDAGTVMAICLPLSLPEPAIL
ncbi:MAG: ATP-binding protein [bacterium]